MTAALRRAEAQLWSRYGSHSLVASLKDPGPLFPERRAPMEGRKMGTDVIWKIGRAVPKGDRDSGSAACLMPVRYQAHR
jgi:hypothetical protein